MSKVLLIKNPIAGRDSKRIETGDIISAFKEYDIECFEKTTTCHGDAVEIAKKYSNDFTYEIIAQTQGDIKWSVLKSTSESLTGFILKNDEIIAKSHNKKEKKMCCLEHAELNVIKKASKKLKNWRLEDCDLYVTLDPCPMCASAIKQARIKNVFSACENFDKGNFKLISTIFEVDSTNNSVNFVNKMTFLI